MDQAAPLGQVQVVPIGDVRLSADNPRRIPAAAIDIVAKSIAEFGWQQPLVVDTGRVVIAGHTRYQAALKLGLATVPVVVADQLTPAQVKAYRIADNRAADFSAWDFPELTAQLDELAQDFSDVLALADWQAVVASFEALPVESAMAAAAIPPAAPYVSPPAAAPAAQPGEPITPGGGDPVVSYLSKGFQLTVVCNSEHAARVAAAALIDMPGVIDVRDKR